jgi:hypothetical protein
MAGECAGRFGQVFEASSCSCYSSLIRFLDLVSTLFVPKYALNFSTWNVRVKGV